VIRPKSRASHQGLPPKTARRASGSSPSIQGLPQASTAAVAVATRLFWALGYNQVESFITRIDPKQMDIDRRHDFAAPGQDVAHAATISKRCCGWPRAMPTAATERGGPASRQGCRPVQCWHRHDDPNDIVPHEHRRSLRALKVFAAWTNLVDMKAEHTLDTVVEETAAASSEALPAGRGSTFGTGANGPRLGRGYEYCGSRLDPEAALVLRVCPQPVADRAIPGVAAGWPVRG
jgi:hypothetical protein